MVSTDTLTEAPPLENLATCESTPPTTATTNPSKIPASVNVRTQITIKELAGRLDLSLKPAAFSRCQDAFSIPCTFFHFAALTRLLRQICYPPLASCPLLPLHPSLPPSPPSAPPCCHEVIGPRCDCLSGGAVTC